MQGRIPLSFNASPEPIGNVSAVGDHSNSGGQGAQQGCGGGRYSRGASHQRKPLRLMKIVPLNTRRSSSRGLPWLLGKNGFIRFSYSSVSQKRLLITTPISSGA
jgi:hypothetical protein